MVAVKTYKVDLDYEAYLFDPNYRESYPANQKIIREFEYVFFLVNKEEAALKNLKKYERSYLNGLLEMGFAIPQFRAEASHYEFWWGNHHDNKLEKALNSKLTSANLAKKNGWGFKDGAIVETLDEVNKHLALYPDCSRWIIKRLHSFSGIGHYLFSAEDLDESVLSKILVEKVLLEPVYDRLFDIGTTFIVKDGVVQDHFMVENFNSTTGGFKGGAGCSSVDKFKKYIQNKYSYSLNELEKITAEIAQAYISIGALSNIQIDSFVYREHGELKLYALVEVNYRKTMGLVIQSLASKYPQSDWIEWRVESDKYFKQHPLDSEWIRLSPDGNHFQSYLKKNFAF